MKKTCPTCVITVSTDGGRASAGTAMSLGHAYGTIICINKDVCISEPS